jgi:citrate synthase
MVSVLGQFDKQSNDNSPAAVDAKSISLTAKFTTILAAFNRLRQGLEPIDPDPSLDHAANFLYMFGGERPDLRTARALDTYLVLLADHEYNASTFAARQITSTLTDTYSAITGAIAALKGPLHGGAPSGVFNMIVEIGTPDRVQEWFDAAMQRKERVAGIGHRVYKVIDPRATVLREHARELTLSTGNPIYYTISRQVELLALSHPYFQERRLYTNVDYYSVTVLYSLGIPVEFMTPAFAVSRIGGWTAHIQEQLRNNRLIRPRAQYVGPFDAVWLPIDERVEGQIPLPDGTIFEPPNV